MDLLHAVWRKSSYSGSETNCVEVAEFDHAVAVRDSKNPSGPALIFGPLAWTAFVATLKQGPVAERLTP
jgi:hypothetical protein